eukprot:Em0002g1246a
MHSSLPRAIEWTPPYQLCTCGEVRVIYYTLAQAILQHQDPTARSDLCDKCDQMLVTLRHSYSDEQRKTINDKYTQHLIKAKDAYNANIEEAEKEWGRKRQKEHEQILGHLESRALMSPFTSHAHLDMQMQYSFDYCQHVSLPYSSQQRGTFYFRTPRKVQVFGVCCEPLSRQVFFLIDEAEQAGKGAVVVLNFMLPGHTKFRPNFYFGLFKKYYRRQDHVYDMEDLADCVRQCGQDVACVPQLYQDWHYYDWNAFLGQWFTSLAGLGCCYTFRFDRKHPGVMKMKTLPSDANPTKVTMLRAGVAIKDIQDAYQSQVMPPVITVLTKEARVHQTIPYSDQCQPWSGPFFECIPPSCAIEWTPPTPVLGPTAFPYSDHPLLNGLPCTIEWTPPYPLQRTENSLVPKSKQRYGMDSTERYFQKTADKYGVDLTVENPLSQTSMEFAVQQATLQ